MPRAPVVAERDTVAPMDFPVPPGGCKVAAAHSKPVAKIRQSISYSLPSTTTPFAVTRSMPVLLVSTRVTFGR